jgi:hypothetical protein
MWRFYSGAVGCFGGSERSCGWKFSLNCSSQTLIHNASWIESLLEIAMQRYQRRG